MAAPPPIPPKVSDPNAKVPEGTFGPHSSKLANAADPRVDSDLDSGRTAHAAAPVGGSAPAAHPSSTTAPTTATGKPVTGFDDPEGTHGPHTSRAANAMDPRVDSDADHRAAGTGVGSHVSGAGYAPGVTPGTAGTHQGVSGEPGHLQGGPAAHVPGGTGTAVGGAGAGAGNTGERVAHGIKGLFAQGHGVGESLRGNINSAIDSFTGDTAKQAQDEETARRGFREVQGKQFERKP